MINVLCFIYRELINQYGLCVIRVLGDNIAIKRCTGCSSTSGSVNQTQ